MNSEKHVIINADDFGLSVGTNEAIVACHQAGSVSSATLMVNMPAAEEAAQLAKNNLALGVGLHFTLTLGSPVCSPDKIRSLVNAKGLFYPRGAMEMRAIAGKINPEEVARELQAQVTRFESLGLKPTHIDSHQHVHLLPGVFDEVADFCVTQNLPLRIPWVWPHATGLSIRKRIRQKLLKKLIKRNMDRWSGALHVNRELASIFDLGLKPEAISTETFRYILEQNTSSLLEVMVHPSRVNVEHRELTRISDISKREYEVLSACNLKSVAATLGYQVVHYGQVNGALWK